ncbi:MAG TPA: leucyl/phenylalanyl-tRNA--protein transferase [Fimbriimonadaceae bacterium]|nr:leucyl/phenylalanyl-tRNA--protein transferase [Fimbriimonadaceae bacterium]
MRGEELTPWLIRYAYSQAAFPMTMEDGQVEWFQPHRRALFPISGIHVSKSLGKVLRKVRMGATSGPQLPAGFRVTFDAAFEQVMRGCLRPDENWISEEFIRVYTQIHHEGWAHSVEVWSTPQYPDTPIPRPLALVGGLYGLALGSCFCAESMFHRETDASKVALWAMVERCRALGFTIFDAQIMNPHLASLGAYEIPHEEYMAMLEQALRMQTPWDPA